VKNLFLQLSKVEEQADGTCIVRGTATAEQPDLVNEIFDWATGKPQVEKWRDAALKRSGGKSLGNIRAMHGKDMSAAGIAKSITFDDVSKSIEVESHIVDLADAKKCITGTYTGYSIGGGYVSRWADPVIKGAMRYTPSLTEISLVDSPCLESALFSYVKVDGSSELRKFAPPVHVAGKGTLSDADVTRLAKAVTALAGDKAIKTADTEALIKKLALRKGMWDVGTLASIMAQIAYMEESLTYEADFEGDASKIPAQLRTALIGLKQIFLDPAAEEVSELVGDDEAGEAAKALAAQINKEVGSMLTSLKKAIAMAGASTDPEMKKMEAHLTEIGKHVDKIAKCHADMEPHIDALQGGEKAEPTADEKKEKDDAEKAAAAGTLNKANDSRFAALEASNAALATSIAKSNEVLSLIAQRLVPTQVSAVAVAKVADVAGVVAPALITDPTEAIKAAHVAGMTRRIA
jgi:hypothetical protein